MKNQVTFYQLFYGFEFNRHFTRPPDFKSKQFKIQFIVKNPQQLYLHVHKNSGFHPCYASVYDHGSKDNLNKNNQSELTVCDRAFFDFDIDNKEAHHIKKQLQNLRFHGLNHQRKTQEDLIKQLQTLITDEHIAEPAINEAKDFAIMFKEYFDTYPILFFSGCKGAHAYTFFEQVKNVDLNRALTWFANEMKETYHTLDLSVNKNAINRLSRVPYSKHQYSGLTVVPFTIDDNYDEIMTKSLSPGIEPFTREYYYSNFGKYLQKIDSILKHNQKVKNAEKRASRAGMKSPVKKIDDHREWFNSILGEPAYKSPNKPYVMYNCPFSDHDDHNPSFMVYPTGYHCKGCNRKGNYFQFLKDINSWSDEEVKAHLKVIDTK